MVRSVSIFFLLALDCTWKRYKYVLHFVRGVFFPPAADWYFSSARNSSNRVDDCRCFPHTISARYERSHTLWSLPILAHLVCAPCIQHGNTDNGKNYCDSYWVYSYMLCLSTSALPTAVRTYLRVYHTDGVSPVSTVELGEVVCLQ